MEDELQIAVISTMQQINEPVTIRHIAGVVSQKKKMDFVEVKKEVQNMMKGGTKFGFIERRSPQKYILSGGSDDENAEEDMLKEKPTHECFKHVIESNKTFNRPTCKEHQSSESSDDSD